jgi:hypothetical protein
MSITTRCHVNINLKKLFHAISYRIYCAVKLYFMTGINSYSLSTENELIIK